ncbi:MAG: hypothetical protein GY814_20480, partial [Gammaproteobacteria bacterium]|nr:hypothetical protein [Gammaproteobacteria bacterium]
MMDSSVGNYATAYRDYTTDQEFVMVTDVNGESSVEEVLLGVLHASDNANNSPMALETFTTLADDFEEIVFMGFGYLPQKRTYDLKGVGVNVLSTTLFEDAALTETIRAVIDAYTLLSNGERIHDRLHSMKTVPDTSIASFPDYETPFVTAVGTFLDFGDIACFIADTGDTAVITTDNTDIIGIIDNVSNIVGSVRMNCGDKLTPTSGGFNGVISRTGIIVDGSTDIDGWAAVGDLYINNAKDITDVPVTGDLYIDTKTGQNEVVSYANVKVSGVLYNPSLYNIEIQA